jgi:hypothetical protein
VKTVQQLREQKQGCEIQGRSGSIASGAKQHISLSLLMASTRMSSSWRINQAGKPTDSIDICILVSKIIIIIIIRYLS